MHALDDGRSRRSSCRTAKWIRLFHENGFEIEDLIELRPADGVGSSYRDDEELAWARRWPAEEIWRVRKR